MVTNEAKKVHALDIIKIIDYAPHSVVSADIIKKISGSISIVAIDKNEKLKWRISPFDTFIEIIEGKTEIAIDNKSIMMEAGQSIIIPAHARNSIKAGERLKMLVTILKSGYKEELLDITI